MAAMDSANPFQTPIQQHASLDGRPVAKQTPMEENKLINEPQQEEVKRKRGRPPKAALESIEEEIVVEPKVEAEPEHFENPIIASHNAEGCPSYRCEFEGRDIFIGLPWYKTSNPVTTAALFAMALDFGKDKIRMDLVMGDALIYQSRNKIAQRFLETDAKWLFMLDDDIIPCIGRAAWYKSWVVSARATLDQPLQRHVLHRLVGAGKSLVGGAYFGRQEGGRLMCSNQALAGDARTHADKVIPVDWVGTGAMLVHRRVFADMAQKFPELETTQPDMKFDFFRPGEGGLGEDISFCRRAKACGHQPHVDLGIPLAHLGYKAY